ncbi:MAG: ImmA/IrrE family metallo-endopeptidase [Anaerolineae bacterium]|nr:ImmA/IrrE family metallo-endopeptidase [Anaerolineae bacterium]
MSEKELHRLVRDLARRTRQDLDKAEIAIDDFDGIAHKYDFKFAWQEMSLDKDGHYAKGVRIVTLNNRIMHLERHNFSFCHEFTHDRIDCDNALFEVIHEFTIDMSDEDMERLIERLCNIGAAELLIPSEDVRQVMLERGFSTSLIPELCERFGASSIAVAFQMVNCASHDCYLVIAEKQIVQPTAVHNQTPLLNIKPINVPQEQLVIIYSGASPVAKYSIKRNQTLSNNHLLYKSLHANEPVRGDAKLPFASGNGWDVPCEALYFRGKVFAFFNRTQPMSNLQMSLF